MRSRFPWTISLMLLADLLRLVALTGAILVVIIAFAATVQPLTDGRLSPAQTLKFLALALLPMLQYALPFASGFAATLVYHRFAAENEALAAHAGGVSHRGLLAPALAVGVALALLLAALSHAVSPWFLREMQTLKGPDLARIVLGAIESGQSVRLRSDLTIHADSAERRDPTPYGAIDHLALRGVLAVRTDADNNIEWEASSRLAGVWVFNELEGSSGGVIRVRLLDGVIAQRGEAAASSSVIDLKPISLAGIFKDSPKFYSALDLEKLRQNPDPIPAVNAKRRDLAAALETHRIAQTLNAAARHDGRIRLVDSDGAVVAIPTSGLTPEKNRWRIEPARPGRPVELSWRLSSDRARLQSAQAAYLVPDDTAVISASRPTLRLELDSVTTQNPSSDAPAAATRSHQTYSALSIPGDESESLLTATSRTLLARAETNDSPLVLAAADNLRNEIASLRREITSRHHERSALSVACLVMVLVGAIVALRLRDARPLLVYAWSFFPSLIAIITVTGGQGVMHREGLSGAPLLWGGVIVLAAFAALEFARLRRH